MSHFELDRTKNPRAIEIELTQKAESRYKEIFYRYSNMVGYGGLVLYMTGWPSGPEVLRKLIQKWDKPFIYVTSLQRFRTERGRCQFIGCRGDDDYFPGQKEEPMPAEPSPAPALPPPQEVAETAVSGQEAPQKASLDAPREPAQWGGGPAANPYGHLPPPLRPKGWR